MCGIAGVIGPQAEQAADQVRRMLKPIGHRGPDGEGLYSVEGVTLGHRRLSILDLSSLGSQPMTRGPLAVTYNGEIYNFVELRQELAALGHRFATNSDTEVLLAAYAEWGKNCVQRFDGMWAFALHDSRSHTVFCSRDRYGEKPFLFLQQGRTLTFGSEIRQFQAARMGLEPNFESLLEFVAFGGKRSIEATYNSSIINLRPATNMVVCCKSGRISSYSYYTAGTSGLFSDLEDAEVPQVLRQEFQRAITTRLRSDVTVGMLLSGGIDSSLVASVAGPAYQEATGNPLLAVTAMTGERQNDESPFARAVAQNTGLAWEPVNVSATTTREAWAEASRIIEQPLASSSHVLQLQVMTKAKDRGCTVILDGQGADETWMGYPRYVTAAIGEIPPRERVGFLLRSADTTGLGLARLLAYWAYFGHPQVALRRLRHRLRPLGLKVGTDWYLTRFAESIGQPARSSIEELQRQQLGGEQLGALLRYADRTSMAVSLEDRLPFLDYRLVELALATPASVKFKDGWTKWPLRRQLAETVPSSVAWRKGKIGFEAPSTTFLPDDPPILDLIRKSEFLAQLGVRMSDLNSVHRSILWRLFSIALWEVEHESG